MKKGYQLFSAWERCMEPDGLRETIRQVAAMGYDGVEFFTYAGIPADEVKTLLAECGVEAFNAHVQLERWEADAEAEITYAKVLGMKRLTIPYIAPENRSEDTYQKLEQNIPLWGKKCRENGITLLYHNHEFEFEQNGDSILLDRILGFDDEMMLELDTFWAMFAGVDPIAFMEKEQKRLGLVHIKDYFDLDQRPFPAFAAIGTGKMDVRPIVDKAKELEVEWIVVEQDNSRIDVMESARLSINTLNQWL